MRTINIEEDLYSHLLKNTVDFGESPSSVLRRLLGFKHVEHLVEEIQTDKKSDQKAELSEIEKHISSLGVSLL